MGIKPTSGDHVVIPPDNTQSRWGEWEAELEDKGEVAGEVLSETWALANSANTISEKNVKDVNLLSPLLDYGSCYVNPNNRVHGTGWAVFSEQIGPMRGCEMITDSQGGIRLLDKGLWDIRLHLSADAFFQLPTQTMNVRIELRVYSPDGGLYSVQAAASDGEPLLTQTIVSSVVVPDSGYRVRVYVTRMFSGRGILGGPKWSRLTVQHISRDVSGGTGGESSDEPSS